jgi:hypothetical protein
MLICSLGSLVLASTSRYGFFYGRDVSELVESGYLYFLIDSKDMFIAVVTLFIFPLVVTLPYSDSYNNEKIKGIQKSLIIRTGKVKYFISKYIVIFTAGFLVIFIPLSINLIATINVAPINNNGNDITHFGSYMYTQLTEITIFPKLFAKSVVLVDTIHLFITSFFGGLIALFGFTISIIFNLNRLSILLIPTIIYNLSNYGFALTGNSSKSLYHLLHVLPNGGIEGVFIPIYIVILSIFSFIGLIASVNNKDIL